MDDGESSEVASQVEESKKSSKSSEIEYETCRETEGQTNGGDVS